jgi:hypothetical protein
MSDTEEHVEVELEEPKKADASEPEVEIEEPKAKKIEKVEEKREVAPEEGIETLKKRLETEKRRAEEAEKRAHQAKQQIAKAHQDVKDSNYQLVSNALETAKGRAEALKTAFAEALSVGDHNRVAEVQAALIENESHISELKRGKKALKQQLKEAEKAKKSEIKQMDRSIDPIDQMAQTVSPRSASWLRDNRENLRDERSIRKMFRAHEDAVDDGIVPDSDDYFAFIEQRMGWQKAVEPEPMSEAAPPKRQAPPPAAPVSRGGQRQNVVRLSAAEADTARSLGMTPEEYAKNKVLLQKEGRYGH